MKTYYIKAYVKFPSDNRHTVVGDIIAATSYASAISQFYADYEIPEVPTPTSYAQIIAITEIQFVK